MSFPSVRGFATSNTNAPNINLPSIVIVGDILLVIIRCTSGSGISWPIGWTELFDNSNDGSNDRMAAAWKTANGSEGGTVIVLSSSNAKFAALSIAVQDASALTLGIINIGNNPSQPNAGICNPGIVADYLWFTFYGMEGEQTAIGAYPSGYILSQTGIVTTNIAGAPQNNCTMAGAGKQLNAVSEDAGVWNVSGGLRDWMAGTIAFHPIIIPPTPPSSFLPSGGSSISY
jgi:hypothetical protein